MHQQFDLSPCDLHGLYIAADFDFQCDNADCGCHDHDCPGYRCPYCDDPDCSYVEDREPGPPTPKPYLFLETLKGTLLAQFEFPEPVALNNGDVLSFQYTIEVDGRPLELRNVQYRVVRPGDPDYPEEPIKECLVAHYCVA